MNHPTRFDPTSAAERIGARINTLADEQVRASLWTLWIYAVHAGAEPAGAMRNWFFMHRMVPLINRLDPASVVYVGDRRQRDGYPPRLAHDCPAVPALLWAIRQLAFGAEADALAALEAA
jgi:hypothetical protein